MCSFGYVITDSDFNVVEKRDIVMNPASRFYLRRKDGKPEIELEAGFTKRLRRCSSIPTR